MKRLIIVISIAVILSLCLSVPVLAVGDKVHGDKADGPAYQYQETGLPDWGD